jgi:hypothetical protein
MPPASPNQAIRRGCIKEPCLLIGVLATFCARESYFEVTIDDIRFIDELSLAK